MSWNEIRDWHVKNLHYLDIGYNGCVENIEGSYEILIGRDWDINGAHTLKYNDKSLGLCLIGDFNKTVPPDAQLAAAAKLVKMWMRLFQIPITNIKPHSAVNQTDCPGSKFPWQKFLDLLV